MDWRHFSIPFDTITQAPVVEVQIKISTLGHGKRTPSKRSVPCAPNTKRSPNDALQHRVFVARVVPELYGAIQRARQNSALACAIPVNAIDFTPVSLDGAKRLHALALIPDAKKPVVG